MADHSPVPWRQSSGGRFLFDKNRLTICEVRLVSADDIALIVRAVNSHHALVEALEWYGEQARLARLIHSEGDAGRHELAADGGKRARAALAAAKGEAE